MVKNKSILVLITVICGLLLIGGAVQAKSDKQTTTSTINGVTANWEYYITDDGKIEDLKCTNAADVTGKLTIPSTLDGKTVTSLGASAFKDAINITEVTIPDSVESISSDAFKGCTKLAKADFGSIKSIGANAFASCTALEDVTIPKTLESAALYPVFNNCPNLKEIKFEKGLKRIPEKLCSSTYIERAIVPDSVESIGYDAFKGCARLTKVDLGSIKSIGANAFSGCSSLESVTIPKTLDNGPLYPVFDNCEKLTEIKFEDGLASIISRICQSTNITSAEIPDSATSINYLSFANCPNLEKITILDNVTRIDKDAFKNHSENLTIYCYEGSVAAKYAIDNNIKYVYLKKPNVVKLSASVTYNPKTNTTKEVVATIKTNKKVNKVEGWTLSEDGKTLTKTYKKNTEETIKLIDIDGQEKSVDVKVTNIIAEEEKEEEAKKKDEEKKSEDKKSEEKKSDNNNSEKNSKNESGKKSDKTVTPVSKLPQTGESVIIIAIISIVSIATIVLYKKTKQYKGIK
jgi:hypothetical protein